MWLCLQDVGHSPTVGHVSWETSDETGPYSGDGLVSRQSHVPFSSPAVLPQGETSRSAESLQSFQGPASPALLADGRMS